MQPHLEQDVRQLGLGEQTQIGVGRLRAQLSIGRLVALASALRHQPHEPMRQRWSHHIAAQLEHLARADMVSAMGGGARPSSSR